MRRRNFHAVVITLLLLLIIFILILSYEQFQLKKVFIQANNSDVKGMTILNGKNVLLIQEKTIEKQLTKLNPIVANVAVVKILPNSLFIQIIDRDPIANITNRVSEYQIDKEGIIIQN